MTEDLMAEASSSSSAAAASGQAAAVPAVKAPSRGIDLITGPDGDILGIAISPVAQLYAMVDKVTSYPRPLSLPIAERYALAGQVAGVPSEHARLVERLASVVATSQSEAASLNALLLFEVCQELVPGFKAAVPDGRLQRAAELSVHERVQAAVLRGEKPKEWEQVEARTSVMLLPQEEEDLGLIGEAGRAVGDGAKFVGSAALGGVGLVTDTLGLTSGAENALADGAEDAVDLLGDGVGHVVGTLDQGLDDTADELRSKGVIGAVGDGVADAVDLVSDFVGDAVTGIAGSVKSTLDWVVGDQASPHCQDPVTHKVMIVVAELFGEERSLGLRLENRIVTRFTKLEAEQLGWVLGDHIIGVGAQQVSSQDSLLAAIGEAKEVLKNTGTPIRFLVERLGARP